MTSLCYKRVTFEDYYKEISNVSYKKKTCLTLGLVFFFFKTRSMPISPNNSNHKRDSQMSKMVTTVPPCNPFNQINKLEEVLESKVQWTMKIWGQMKVIYWYKLTCTCKMLNVCPLFLLDPCLTYVLSSVAMLLIFLNRVKTKDKLHVFIMWNICSFLDRILNEKYLYVIWIL